MPMRPWILRCTVAWLLVFTSASSFAETLQVYGDDKYPPIIYTADGKPTGVLASLLRQVSERTGDAYALQLFPWKRAYEMARAGRAAIVGISKTKERSEQFDFSDPLYFDDIQIVVKKGHAFPYSQLSDLKGKTVGGVAGASYGEVVDAAIKDGLFKVDQDIGQQGRLHKLLSGRVDAAFIGNGIEGFDMAVRSDPVLQARRAELVILPIPLTRDPLFLAVAKSMGKKALLERFNQALHDIQSTAMLKVQVKRSQNKYKK